MNFRKADRGDTSLIYQWVNDPLTREQSFSSEPIAFENHKQWFEQKVNDPDHHMLIFEVNNEPVGQVRFDLNTDYWVIGVNIAPEQRGKGYGSKVLTSALTYIKQISELPVYAYIKETNLASIKSFSRAGFKMEKDLIYHGINSVLYIWK